MGSDATPAPFCLVAGPFLVLRAQAQQQAGEEPKGVLDAFDSGQVESLLDPQDLAVLAIEPELPPLPSLDEGISEQLLLQVTGAPDLVNITHINLHGMGLEVVEGLSACPALQTLILSFNKLTKLDGLYGCSALTRLELGYNLIRRLDGLKGLMALTHLEMSHNALMRVEELTSLKKYTPNLIELDLRGNALCDSRAYRGLVMRRLPKLTLLDGLTVTEQERAAAIEASSSLNPALIRTMVDAAAARGEGDGRRESGTGGPTAAAPSAPAAPASRPTTSGPGDDAAPGGGDAAGAGDASGGASDPPPPPDDPYWDTVKELVIERQQLRRLASLTPLRRLWRASFAGNEISRIEGLEKCTLLEELSLEDNRITAIEGLSTLTKLRKLDLGKNRISRCHGLSQLTCLTQLSLEDNCISTLAGLGQLTSLMELYLGNNQIAVLREINSLKMLPRLIILDLIGNPIVETDEYRLYTVFHLRKLKVLDSVAIDLTEAGNAKQRYAGRLTRDLIEERLGHSLEAALQFREQQQQGQPMRGSFKGNTLQLLRSTSGSAIDANATGGGIAAGANTTWGDGSLRLPGGNGTAELHHSMSDGEGLHAHGGGGHAAPLESLDLSQCRLRDLGGVFAGAEFQALRDICLDNNLLTDVKQLSGLPSLHVRARVAQFCPCFALHSLRCAGAVRNRVF